MARKSYEKFERNIVARIKAARLELGWTQTYLAKKVGIARPRISQMESGYYQGVTVRTLFSFAEALGEQPQDLLMGKPKGA